MNKSESIKELAVALSKVQKDMPPVEKNATNPFLKNRYADLGSTIRTSTPILAKYGLSLSQFPTSNGDKVGLTSILMHQSGEWIEDTIYLSPERDDNKAVNATQTAGKQITYLRRYAWSSILGMNTDEDNDGNAPQQKTQPKRQPKQAQKQEKAETNGNRPYAPETVRDKIAEVVTFPSYVDYDASDKQRQLLRYGLELCFAGDDNAEDKRHTLLLYLAGDPSTKQVSGAVVKAMLDKWLEIQKDEDTGDYLVSPMAIKEAQTIVTQALADEGQQALL